MRFKWSILIVGMITLPLVLQWNALRFGLRDLDEAGWFLSTPYYTYAKEGNFTHKDWQGEESLDHPPLLKYFFGALLDAQGIAVSSYRPLHYWQEAFAHYLKRQAVEERLFQLVPFEVVHRTRLVLLLVTLGAAVVFYRICQRLWNKKIALASVTLLLWNPAFSYFSVQILAEALLFLWLVLFLWGTMRWFAALSRETNSLFSESCCLGLVLGCAMASKFTCVVFPLLFVVFTVWALLTIQKRRQILLSFVGVTFLSWAIFWLFNPSLWFRTFDYFAQMSSFRAGLLGVQNLVYRDLLFPWYAQSISFFRVLWSASFTHDTLPGLSQLPLLSVALAVFFVVTCRIGKINFALSEKKIFFTTTAALILLSFVQFAGVSYTRYLYLMWPCLSVCAVLGLRNLWSMLRQKQWQELLMPSCYVLCFLFATYNASQSKWFLAEKKIFSEPLAVQNVFFEKKFLSDPQVLFSNIVAHNALVMGDLSKAKLYTLVSLTLDPKNGVARWILYHLHEADGGPERFMAQFVD